MKRIKILLFAVFFAPVCAYSANSDFTVAAQLLAAAKNADIQQVQALVNNGADINYVDATGLSLVCTALMNKDFRAAQILQMYGADASVCDKQIKQYNLRTKTESSGGLFSGLSTTQEIALAAAGAAVVVGGLFFLTDIFDSDNGNNSSGSGADRPNNNNGEGDTTGSEIAFTIPYGPAMKDADAENTYYTTNLNLYSPSDAASILYKDFNLMTNDYGQNYLLMMHGYSALARGYLGMRTLRNTSSLTPFDLSGYNLGNEKVLGGRPVNVALITANGINAAPVPANSLSASVNSLDDTLLPWTTKNGTGLSNADYSMISSKYYNNKIVSPTGTENTGLVSYSTTEDGTKVGSLDLSGYGTAVNNTNSTNGDNLLAKIVIGATGGYSNADFVGFMPNGQLTVFRTGGGNGMVTTTGTNGTYSLAGETLATNDILGLFSKELLVARTDNQVVATAVQSVTFAGDTLAVGDTFTLDTKTLTVKTVSEKNFTATYTEGETVTSYNGYWASGKLYVYAQGTTDVYNGYIGADGLLYLMGIDVGGNNVNQAYTFSDSNVLTLTKQSTNVDYYNYKALLNAVNLYAAGDLSDGRSQPVVLANASVIAPLHSPLTATIDDVLALSSTSSGGSTAQQDYFGTLVNKYYDVNTTDGSEGTNDLPGTNARTFFNSLGSSYSPLVVFSTGAYQLGADEFSAYSGRTLSATFENAAPIVFSNLSHLFMSVVPVGQVGTGTQGTTSVSGYSAKNKYAITQWSETSGSETTYYRGRTCGVAGTGTSGSDPWCFAATGITDGQAVSAAAGAVGALFSAFDYMTPKQIFTLLALTADGPFLKTDSSGNTYTTDGLVAYLKTMYQMPYEYQYRWEYGNENYLDVFKEVFGYGLINLERATTPGKSIYYYDGQTNKIVSSSGNAYWRSATNTSFRTSSAFSPRATTISASFYDVLESLDGSISLPRVWENEFSLTSQDKRGLYMGDVLGDLKTRKEDTKRTQIGEISLKMSVSEREYADNFAGLDELSLDFARGNWSFYAGYQHHFTDGVSRFNGMANPVLNLASNAIISGLAYNSGNWSFAGRAFSGSITDEGLLENDPTISAQYAPARLGFVQGGMSSASWNNAKFGFTSSVGAVHETNTLLGAQTDGLLNLGAGNTLFVDAELRYAPVKDVALLLRSTFAKTTSDATGEFILGLSDIYSDSYAAGVDVGNFSFTVARPLAITRGYMHYSHADYEVVEQGDGQYALNITNAGVSDIDLRPGARELRFTGTYRHKFGTFTDGAIGFIYRINPNNIDKFGNESIFMMKMTHRIGI